jgi:hypothetical protein
MPVENVPPAGETVIVTGRPFVQTSFIGVIATDGAGTTVNDVDEEA